jgi:hypothetical protein
MYPTMAFKVMHNHQYSSSFDELSKSMDGREFSTIEEAEDAIEGLFGDAIDSDCILGDDMYLWYFDAEMNADERADDTEGEKVILAIVPRHFLYYKRQE